MEIVRINPQLDEPDLSAGFNEAVFLDDLTELCRKHRCGIEGGQVWLMDPNDTGPDSDCNARYVFSKDGVSLVRSF